MPTAWRTCGVFASRKVGRDRGSGELPCWCRCRLCALRRSRPSRLGDRESPVLLTDAVTPFAPMLDVPLSSRPVSKITFPPPRPLLCVFADLPSLGRCRKLLDDERQLLQKICSL